MHKESHRFYRYQHRSKHGLVSFEVKYRETDLWIRAQRNLEREAMAAVLNCRHQLDQYISRHPEFLHSLTPISDDPLASPLVRTMMKAGQAAGVGPMASVAGAIAQSVANSLKIVTESIIVENGGDCYMDMREEINVGIFAGPRSPFTGRLAVRLSSDRFPLGICTSSGTIGHSLSFGKADAVTVISKGAALADASATALGNAIQSPEDIGKALEMAQTIEGAEGVLVIVGDKMGAWGDLELSPL